MLSAGLFFLLIGAAAVVAVGSRGVVHIDDTSVALQLGLGRRIVVPRAAAAVEMCRWQSVVHASRASTTGPMLKLRGQDATLSIAAIDPPAAVSLPPCGGWFGLPDAVIDARDLDDLIGRLGGITESE